ncbi:Tetratricopeptide repeat (TPR)-like superfamily protein [Abeliophyllum distichum]|uniref:Tetratricopeptide repeat (TPR)-like superfamily protein n=1 Tax=Abeliophyllum distichum TaxID=126358 RepID=A0ABD1Q312_9LAMI
MAPEVHQYTMAAEKTLPIRLRWPVTPPFDGFCKIILRKNDLHAYWISNCFLPWRCFRLFERGLAYVGTDYQCFPLWDKYIEYEISQQDWPRVATIYTRLLEIPNQQLDRYFEGFKELVASRPLSELRTPEEAAAAASANTEADGQKTEGEDPANAAEQTSTPSLKTGITILILLKVETTSTRLSSSMKDVWWLVPIILNTGYAMYCAWKLVEVWSLLTMHLLVLLKFLSRDNQKSIFLLLDSESSTVTFPELELLINLFTQKFRPGLLEAIIRHANMEHRLGNMEDACSLYEQSIAIEKGKEHSQTLPLLFAQYSRFLYLVSGKVEKAREILDQAVENIQLSKPLLEALIHLESIQSLPKRIDYLDSLVDKFIVPDTDSPIVSSIAEREELSSIFLEFLDLFGDAHSIKKADDRHAKLFLRDRSTSESKKRHAEDYLISDKTKLAKSVTSSSTPSVVGAFPNTQNQWPAGYGVQPQAWPQATQAQVPQWNPGYAQQAAYGAYGSYGTNYTHQQVPTSVPQSAAYGTYPPTYSAQQAFPQQSYAQPTAAATTPAQPPSAVPPSTYYSSFY